MPKVHTVKKARKAYKADGIKKGEPYFWWKHKLARGGILRRSKTHPRPSQLTLSEFWSSYLAAQEAFQDSLNGTNLDDVAGALEEFEDARSNFLTELEEIKDSQNEKLDNMPDGLREGDTGQLLQERYDGIEALIDELQAVDISGDDLDTIKTDLEACEYSGS